MAKTNKKGLGIIIIIAILIILAIYAWIQLQRIYISQFMFWVTVVLIPLGSVIAIISVGYLIKEGSDSAAPWIVLIVCIILVIFSITQIGNFYNKGYSNQAIQKEIELKGEISQYELAIGFLSDPEGQVTDLAIEGAINSLCNTNPDQSCQQIKDILIWKDRSDKVAKLMGIIG